VNVELYEGLLMLQVHTWLGSIILKIVVPDPRDNPNPREAFGIWQQPHRCGKCQCATCAAANQGQLSDISTRHWCISGYRCIASGVQRGGSHHEALKGHTSGVWPGSRARGGSGGTFPRICPSVAGDCTGQVQVIG